jgi:hypothetical protein
MARFARVAASAVLVALSVCAQAGAAFPVQLSQGLVRLEPARMFNPDAESLFAALTATPHFMSPIDIGVFNIAGSEELAIRDGDEQFSAPHGAGVADVKLTIPRLRAYSAYTASAPVQVSAPRLADPKVNLAPPRVQSPGDAVAVRTAPPALTTPQAAPVHFGTYAPYTPSLRGETTNLSLPGRVGNMHFQTAFHAMQVCGTADEGAACASANATAAQSFSAGTDFNVRTGNSAVNVGLSSSVEHVNNATAGMFPYLPADPDAQAGLTYFGLTNVVSQSVGARLAVPVNRRITVGLQYDRAHYQGDYGNTLLPGYDASKDTYLGNITYQLPNNSSAITLSARQYRYQDTFAPNFNLTQTRADLNFTVKF